MPLAIKCCNCDTSFIVDDDDIDRVSRYKWELVKSGVYGDVDGKYTSLSRYILGVNNANKKVLRRNRTAFDYRKENLFYGNTYYNRGRYYDVECYDGRFFKISKDSKSVIDMYQWRIDKNGYVITKTNNGRILKLHRLLLDVIDTNAVEVDHINRDPLDNRMDNIRIANRSLNCFNRDVANKNTSGVIGVYKMSGYENKWCAQINYDGVRKYLGSYNSFEDAVSARKTAEKIFYKV